jgi:ketosteroid isomerase-like protein
MDCKTQIAALVAPWVQACLDRDWDALLALCTDDVVFAPPGEPSVSGEESLKTWLDDFPVMTAFEFSFDQIDESDDLAVGFGEGSMTVEMDDETASMTIKFADVFRRQADGTWLYSHVIWNGNES